MGDRAHARRCPGAGPGGSASETGACSPGLSAPARSASRKASASPDRRRGPPDHRGAPRRSREDTGHEEVRQVYPACPFLELGDLGGTTYGGISLWSPAENQSVLEVGLGQK